MIVMFPLKARQLGGVVVAVTVLSILGAIVTLPAALMLVPSPLFFGQGILKEYGCVDRIWIEQKETWT